jgi:PAS domain S-box-containing protein
VTGRRHGERDQAELRREAESRLAARPPASPASRSAAEAAAHLHELQVHQIELELQNEELRRAREELEEARDRYLDLYDFAPVGYLDLDAEDRMATINLAGATMLGISRAELVSKAFDRFVAPPDRPAWAAHLRAVRDHAEPQSCELLLEPAGRVPFAVQMTSVRKAAPGGGAPNVRCTMKDITDRRRYEAERDRRIAELSELNQRLEQAQLALLEVEKLAAVAQLAAGVAHEINNPLSYMMSNLFLIEECTREFLGGKRAAEKAGEPRVGAAGTAGDGKGIGAVRELMEQSLAETRAGMERISGVVRGLRAFSRPEVARWQPAELHEILERSMSIVATVAGGNPTWVREFGQKEQRLRCRPVELGQAFTNVLLNAVQAVQSGGTVTIRTGGDGEAAWVEVVDTGPGIPALHLHRIFEPYFTTRPVGTGTGLGLTIAHAIVRAHRGRIEARSEVTKGSTFRIVIPIDGEPASTPWAGDAPVRPTEARR